MGSRSRGTREPVRALLSLGPHPDGTQAAPVCRRPPSASLRLLTHPRGRAPHGEGEGRRNAGGRPARAAPHPPSYPVRGPRSLPYRPGQSARDPLPRDTCRGGPCLQTLAPRPVRCDPGVTLSDPFQSLSPVSLLAGGTLGPSEGAMWRCGPQVPLGPGRLTWDPAGSVTWNHALAWDPCIGGPGQWRHARCPDWSPGAVDLPGWGILTFGLFV